MDLLVMVPASLMSMVGFLSLFLNQGRELVFQFFFSQFFVVFLMEPHRINTILFP